MNKTNSKKKQYVYLVGCLIITLIVAGCASSSTHATVWEYKIVSGQFDGPLQAEINKAAEEGWVLVSASSKVPETGFAVMKRPKRSQ